MKGRIFFVGLSLVILLAVSFIYLSNNWAAGEGSSQSDPQQEIRDKLDEILANQGKLSSRLDVMEENLIHEIRIRATK